MSLTPAKQNDGKQEEETLHQGSKVPGTRANDQAGLGNWSCDFAVVRTPLLAWDELHLPKGGGQDSPRSGTLSAAGLDAKGGGDPLFGHMLGLPEMSEALSLASFGLWNRTVGEGTPDRRKGQNGEELTFYRYLVRSVARATPFGLFAGVSLAKLGGFTDVFLLPRAQYRRRTRLDMEFCWGLVAAREAHTLLGSARRLLSNSSLFRLGGRYHLVEARQGTGGRTFFLTAAEATAALDRVLEEAKGGAATKRLVECLTCLDPTVSESDANEFLRELVGAQVLLTDLRTPLTGSDPLQHLLSVVPRWDKARRSLREGEATLSGWDARGLGVTPREYEVLAVELMRLAPNVSREHLFQVDLFKPLAHAIVGKNVASELLRGAGLLSKMCSRSEDEGLEKFKIAFSRRYGEAEIPLLEALDEEAGAGFGSSSGRSNETLLESMSLRPARAERANSASTEMAALAVRLAERAWRHGLGEVEMTSDDLAPVGVGGLPLPDAFAVFGSVAASSTEAVREGEFRVFVKNVSGPSGARLLGRFCHLDSQLHDAVCQHLRCEEALRPDAIFAEIVHLPEERLGNVLIRPVLREHEIPYLATSGASQQQQIPVQDLFVSIHDGRIVLRSKSLRREVLPRLTTAHNYNSLRNLPVYRFLCTLQSQGVAGNLGWDWGPLEAAAFLPRVRCGRIVFVRARWRVKRPEFGKFKSLTGAARFHGVNQWRTAERMPRFVYIVEADNELLVDFESPLAVDVLVAYGMRRQELRLAEMFPGPDDLWLKGPEGKFVHEIIVPFVRKQPARDRQPIVARDEHVVRNKPNVGPGSECLYAKVYCGHATADRVLIETIAPLANSLLSVGDITNWFFIRYGDPDWHLRVRFFGEPARLHQEVLPRLQKAVRQEIEGERCWKLQLDTYEREVERYGGDAGIVASEAVFFADSQACCAMLPYLLGDERGDDRWRTVLLGIDRLLDDLGFSLAEKANLLRAQSHGFRREFDFDGELKKRVAERFRKERALLERLLVGEPNGEPYPKLEAILGERSQRCRLAMDDLRRLLETRCLSRPLAEIAGSLIHLHVNRLLRAEHRAQEAVLYNFLYQLYSSRLARVQRGAKPAPAAGGDA